MTCPWDESCLCNQPAEGPRPIHFIALLILLLSVQLLHLDVLSCCVFALYLIRSGL